MWAQIYSYIRSEILTEVKTETYPLLSPHLPSLSFHPRKLSGWLVKHDFPFVNFGYGLEVCLSMFADDTRLGGAADSIKGKKAL